MKNNNEKGFSMVASIGLGLLATSAVSIALMQGAKNKTNTIAQETQFQSMAIAEGKVEKFRGFISSNPHLLDVSMEEWSTTTANNCPDPDTNLRFSFKSRILSTK